MVSLQVDNLRLLGHSPIRLRTRGSFPASVSGRNLLDGNGAPWFAVGDAPWALVGQLTTGDITTYLEDRAAKGMRLVMFSAPENNYCDNAPNNYYGDHPFTGTYFQSTLNGDYWSVVDHAVDTAQRLGITCLICPAYLGCCGDGVRTEIRAASNAQMQTYGSYLGARYKDRPNIMWLAGHDMDAGSTPLTTTDEDRYAALQDGIQGAGDTHLWMPGSGNNDTGINLWGTDKLEFDVDTAYDYAFAPVTRVEAAWDDNTRPVVYIEGSYENESSGNLAGDMAHASIRYQAWASFCAGAVAHLYGCDPIWHFNNIDSGEGTWQSNLDEVGASDMAHLAAVMAAYDWSGTVPDHPSGTFLVGGRESGGTEAEARYTTGLGLVYVPDSRNINIDTGQIEASYNDCTVTRIDPTNGAESVLTTTAFGSNYQIAAQGTNAGGDGDWVFLVEVT